MIRLSAKHSSSRVHRRFMLVRYRTLEWKVLRQIQRLHLPLGVGVLAFNCTSHRWRVL